ncbi:KilA-N domain-containing protein [Aquabacterium sp.]|uniref:KilA-N domain-containing protein n=1 Tax=Aquabacterium sp. TaxID=1872578 RepID=UPI00262BC7A7|nr:KilA-N domain-containing protein [Aquabacterium sp.]MDD2977888.1 KilA-N domain-containing protein [Aquabacterium sp.]
MATHPARANPLILEDTYVRQDDQGRYSLNDLHQAAGGEQRHRPNYWLENQQAKALVAEIETAGIPAVTGGIPPVSSAEGRNGGTLVVRELVYAYAMWISPAFHLKVIRTFDALVTGKLSSSQQPTLVGKATGLALSQLVGLQDQAWKLIQRLERTVVAELRHSLYEQLQDVYADMGKTAPPLSAIGQQAPEVPHATTAFWTAYEALTAVGVRLNHHRDPALIAVNLRQYLQAAAEHKVKVPSRKDLLAALPLSRAPKFCEQRVVNSGVTGVSVHCHVFRAQEGGAS